MKDITEILNRHMHSVSQQKQCTKTQTALNKFVYIFAEDKIKPFVKKTFCISKASIFKDIKQFFWLRNECLGH